MTMDEVFNQARLLSELVQNEIRAWRDRAKARPGVVYTLNTTRLAMSIQYVLVARGPEWHLRMRLFGEALAEGWPSRTIDPGTEQHIAAITATLMVPLEQSDHGGVLIDPGRVELLLLDENETLEIRWPDDRPKAHIHG